MQSSIGRVVIEFPASFGDELTTASTLAPRNALIWYNLAVVESKKGDPAPALEHLKKAESLGLPKNLHNDADQLEAKLSYDVKAEAKKQAFSTKLLQLKAAIEKNAKGECQGDDTACVNVAADIPQPLSETSNISEFASPSTCATKISIRVAPAWSALSTSSATALPVPL